MKFRDVEKLIEADGWVHTETKGSHYQYVHPTKKGKVTIPHHSGDIAQGTVNSICKQAGIKEVKK